MKHNDTPPASGPTPTVAPDRQKNVRTLPQQPDGTLPSPELQTREIRGRGVSDGSDPQDRIPFVEPHRYDVIGQYARGGLGRILEVYDHRLGRTVAIKELIAPDRLSYARFRREAFITARLEHPAIVPVHDVGRWPTGETFYAMKLVSGRSLQAVIDATTTFEQRLALLPNVIAVADAMAYAHSHRVIHRDLKPANVLVGAFGETVVIDWGLAKDLRSADDDDLALLTGPEPLPQEALTYPGTVIGTPHYMPPEQASGEPVDERADVYALGALLYEVLAGKPPYSDASGTALLDQLLAGPPPPVEQHQSGIPLDLVAIVNKAMAREAADRYPSARELVDDLRRFQTGRLVSARRYSRAVLFGRWLRRHRVPVVMATAALTVLITLVVLAVQRIARERTVAQTAQRIAERRANQLILTQAAGALERDPTEALAWLRGYPLDGADWATVRTLAITAVSLGVAQHTLIDSGFLDFTTDGRGWLAINDGGAIEVRALATGRLLGRLSHQGRIEQIALAADGRSMFVLDWNSTTVVKYDLGRGPVARLSHSGHGTVKALAWDDRSGSLITGTSDGTLLRWSNAAAGPERLGQHHGAVRYIALSRDGRWMLSGAAEEAPPQLRELHGNRRYALPALVDISNLALANDGHVAIGQRDGTISFWRPDTGQLTTYRQHRSSVTQVLFSVDGRYFLSAHQDGALQLWSRDRGERMPQVLLGHRSPVQGASISPDSRHLVSWSTDGELRLWELPGGSGRRLDRVSGRINLAMFSPDSRYLASITLERVARLWRVTPDAGRIVAETVGDPFIVRCAALPGPASLIVSGGADPALQWWRLDGQQSGVLPGHHDGIFHTAIYGSWLASASYDGTAQLWNLTACLQEGCAGGGQKFAARDVRLYDVVFSPDGQLVAVAGADGAVSLWDRIAQHEHLLTGGHNATVRSLAFAPDSRWLVSADEDGVVLRWDVHRGTYQRLYAHDDAVNRVAYTPDGSHLASASRDGAVRLWDMRHNQTIVLRGHKGWVRDLMFLDAGRQLASTGNDGTIRIWEVATGQPRAVLEGHRGAVYQLAVSPDGTRLASAGRDRSVRLWNIARAVVEAVFWHEGEVRSVAFAPGGDHLISVGTDRKIRAWPIHGLEPIPEPPAALSRWIRDHSTAVIDARHQLMSAW